MKSVWIFVAVAILIFFLQACKQHSNESPKNELIDNTTEEESGNVYSKSTFLKDVEVQNLINNHQSFFLSSYWAGMTRQEALQVTHLNMKKELIYYRYNKNKEDYIQTELQPNELELSHLDGSWDFLIKTSIETAYVGKMVFAFNMPSLESDVEELYSIHIQVEVENISDYDAFLNLYKSKYRPFKNLKIKNQNKQEGYRINFFEKENIEVAIEMYPSGNIDNSGKVFSENMILISYYDKNYLKHLEKIEKESNREYTNRQEKILNDVKENI